jgi:hypothetical protein
MLPARLLRFGLPTTLLLAAACGSGTTEVIPPPPPPPPAGFTFTFAPDPEDAATAAALSWQSGIPQFVVTVTPVDSSVAGRTFTATATGTLLITDLLAKDYIVEGNRWLSSTEKSRLPASDDALGFAGRWTVPVGSLAGSTRLEVPADRKKGLVISEWAFNQFTGYSFGGFLELHNNADTTVYLDGLILGEGWWASLDAPITPCAVTAPFRNDPQGIWARFFQQFPGTGREYPLAPGGTVAIATDAIDHRPLDPRSLDLSHAGFEFSGLADADNPAVSNMIDIGLISYQSGHGSQFNGLVNVPFISRSVSVPSLPRALGPQGNSEWARFPADAIVDALAIGTNYLPPAGSLDCPPLVNGRFDRKESRARGTDDSDEYEKSLSRRHIPGTNLLQWTRSGNADFVRTTRTPGVP